MFEEGIKYIEENKQYFIKISDYIWEKAETALNENASSSLLTEELTKHGFKIEKNLAGMPTAFKAVWGNGKPTIAFLGEYDALPNLGQEKVPYKKSTIDNTNGHGCGHNLLGTGAFAATIALKNIMEEKKINGSVVYFGCPAEETMTGKIFMVREKCFKDIDVALTWHPSSFNSVFEDSFMSMSSVKFNFYGKTSHAAFAPFMGRSALDAVELMNVGVNYLREHVIPEARIHYTITHGGDKPNIVPDYAQVWYFIRAPKRFQVNEIYKRVGKIAKGAALMTETEVNPEILSGCYELVNNRTLEKLLYKCMKNINGPIWDEKDITFAKEINKSFLPYQKIDQIEGLKNSSLDNEYLHKNVFSIKETSNSIPASSDVSDVSQVVPVGQFGTCCFPIGAIGHTWQITASSGMSIGHKGMLYAAKILGSAGLELILNQNLLNKVKEEFNKNTNDINYISPIPENIKEPIKISYKRGDYQLRSI